ncbi:MAG: hypothetical protein J5857_04530 [Treponema sp.]|nr:hypothetical protein [Treponema sp.]
MAFKRSRLWISVFLIFLFFPQFTVASDTLALEIQEPQPYSIDRDGTFVFTGDFLIYQIDDEYWSADKNPRKLDMRQDHIVRWQSMAYEEGNPVSSKTIMRHGADIYAGSSSGRDTTYPAGSIQNPYPRLEDALKVANEGYQCKIHLVSDINLENSYYLYQDCTIDGGDHTIFFDCNSLLLVLDAELQFELCVLKKESDASYNDCMIKAEKSILSFYDCELSGSFLETASILELNESRLNFTGGGLTMQSKEYSVLINSSNSSISIDESRLTCTGIHATALSVNGGSCSLVNSSCTLWGELGRMVEASGTRLSLYGNTFTGHLSKGDGRSLYIDEICTVIQDEDNSEVFD